MTLDNMTPSLQLALVAVAVCVLGATQCSVWRRDRPRLATSLRFFALAWAVLMPFYALQHLLIKMAALHIDVTPIGIVAEFLPTYSGVLLLVAAEPLWREASQGRERRGVLLVLDWVAEHAIHLMVFSHGILFIAAAYEMQFLRVVDLFLAALGFVFIAWALFNLANGWRRAIWVALLGVAGLYLFYQWKWTVDLFKSPSNFALMKDEFLVKFAVLKVLFSGMFIGLVMSIPPKRDQVKVGLPHAFDATFSESFWKSLARTRAARKKDFPHDIRVEKLIVLHYVRMDFQIGFRAYKGLSGANPTADGSLPLYVYTTSGGAPQTVDFFYWNERTRVPKISRAEAQNDKKPAVYLSNLNGCRNACVFRHYPDPNLRPDFFHLNPFAISEVDLYHYVIVRNTDVGLWTPNKFLLEELDEGDKTSRIQISPAVYQTLFPANSALKNAHQLLSEAEDIISRFLAIPEATSFDSKDSKDNFHLTREGVKDIFHDGSFDSGVTVYWLEQRPAKANLYLAYVFQQ